MDSDLTTKAISLSRIIALLKSAGVAYSGGVDSTLLLAVCREVLGPERVLALTVHSELTPAVERERAAEMAQRLGVRQRVVQFDALSDPGIAANRPDRCYHCKRAMFSRLLEIARAEGLAALVHGATCDDLNDYRPGLRAAEELGVRAPLLEAGFTKEDVRALSRQLGLPTWNLPLMACLASRVPYDTPLTQEALARIDAAESFLRELLPSQGGGARARSLPARPHRGARGRDRPPGPARPPGPNHPPPARTGLSLCDPRPPGLSQRQHEP